MGSFRNVKLYSYSSPVSLGGFCIVSLSYEYMGEQIQLETYGAIGKDGIFGFNEIIHAANTRTVSYTPAWKKYYASVILTITSALDPDDAPYDVYAKVRQVGGGWNLTDIAQNVIYFESGNGGEEYRELEVHINPAGGGYVTTSPASREGKTTWHDNDRGTFPYGTSVQVTAHPASGYVFQKWSDQIVGGVSTSNPAYVQTMTQDRGVECHFNESGGNGGEEYRELEIDITPVGSGYVMTSPASREGKTVWHNNETGTFLYGTVVTVTAIPTSGYVFQKWSDRIQGGVSTSNPAQTDPLLGDYSVKAHFNLVDEPPEEEGNFRNLKVSYKRA
jgi:hypothetical protein